MSVHLNDLSKVYLHNIFEGTDDSDDSKMKKSNKKKDDVEDNEKEGDEKEGDEKKNKNKPRWQDSDGDGKWYEPGEDVATPKKKKVTKESFSNWREDLKEVVKDQGIKTSNTQIKEKNVDNYRDKTVVINPNINENIQILESVELSSDYIEQIINLASQYFYAEGYDDQSIKIIAEGMGHHQFIDFVFDIGNTLFFDEAAYQGELLTTKGQARKNPKTSTAKGASTQVSHTPSKSQENKSEQNKTSSGQLSINFNKKPTTAGQEKVRQAVGTAVKKVTSPQTKKAVGNVVKGAADTAARAALSAWKGHQAAMGRKKEGAGVAKQLGAGLGAAAGAFFKKGKEHLRNSYEFTDWLDYIISEGCDISEWTIKDLYKNYRLNEAVYSGEKINEKEIRKYARTSHEGIPKKKVKEQLEPTTPDQIAAQKKIAVAQDQLNKANKKSLSQKQKTQTTQNVNAGYKLEGNLVDEATPTKLFYKLQAKGKKDSPTGTAQRKSDADLETQKNFKMKAQQSKQRYEREPEEDHPSLSARERNPNLR